MAMHACQIGPTDTVPSYQGLPQRACVETKGGDIQYINIKIGNIDIISININVKPKVLSFLSIALR